MPELTEPTTTPKRPEPDTARAGTDAATAEKGRGQADV